MTTYISQLETLERAQYAAKVVATTVALAAVLLSADTLLENKERGDDGKKRRGRIGIQGNDVKNRLKTLKEIVPTLQWKLTFGTSGSTVSVSNDTLAWGWSRTWPVLKQEGRAALSLLQVQVGQNGLACRKPALEKASAAIDSGPLPQGYSRDWQGENYSFCDGSERVDLQVFQGTAFEQ